MPRKDPEGEGPAEEGEQKCQRCQIFQASGCFQQITGKLG